MRSQSTACKPAVQAEQPLVHALNARLIQVYQKQLKRKQVELAVLEKYKRALQKKKQQEAVHHTLAYSPLYGGELKDMLRSQELLADDIEGSSSSSESPLARTFPRRQEASAFRRSQSTFFECSKANPHPQTQNQDKRSNLGNQSEIFMQLNSSDNALPPLAVGANRPYPSSSFHKGSRPLKSMVDPQTKNSQSLNSMDVASHGALRGLMTTPSKGEAPSRFNLTKKLAATLPKKSRNMPTSSLGSIQTRLTTSIGTQTTSGSFQEQSLALCVEIASIEIPGGESRSKTSSMVSTACHSQMQTDPCKQCEDLKSVLISMRQKLKDQERKHIQISVPLVKTGSDKIPSPQKLQSSLEIIKQKSSGFKVEPLKKTSTPCLPLREQMINELRFESQAESLSKVSQQKEEVSAQLKQLSKQSSHQILRSSESSRSSSSSQGSSIDSVKSLTKAKPLCQPMKPLLAKRQSFLVTALQCQGQSSSAIPHFSPPGGGAIPSMTSLGASSIQMRSLISSTLGEVLNRDMKYYAAQLKDSTISEEKKMEIFEQQLGDEYLKQFYPKNAMNLSKDNKDPREMLSIVNKVRASTIIEQPKKSELPKKMETPFKAPEPKRKLDISALKSLMESSVSELARLDSKKGSPIKNLQATTEESKSIGKSEPSSLMHSVSCGNLKLSNKQALSQETKVKLKGKIGERLAKKIKFQKQLLASKSRMLENP